MHPISLPLYGPSCGTQPWKLPSAGFRINQAVPTSNYRVFTEYHDGNLKVEKDATFSSMSAEESKERIREQLRGVHLPASYYDTAWVAMVPASGSPQNPRFPQCLEWILENQHANGSWGLAHSDPSLIKDTLSSTLACVLALKKWDSGQERVRRGLHFIGSNFSYIFNEKLVAPIGFNIIFPGMLGFAVDLGLDLPFGQGVIHDILSLQDSELREFNNNSKGKSEYIGYIAEGFGNSQDWNKIMKYQKKNGSLFNSPATTAAALTRLYDAKALDYLSSLVQKFGNSVPTIYPVEIYAQLCMVDSLERTGIARYFADDVKRILDKVFRSWMERDEEITSNMETCAMAFRILRMNGYEVSLDSLSQYGEAKNFYNSMQGYLRDTRAVLQIYKASEVKTLPNEELLDKLASWSSSLLKEKMSTFPKHEHQVISKEVEYALKFPFYADLNRLEHKRNIECFNNGKFLMLKTLYVNSCVDNDILQLSIKDFDTLQSIYKEELQLLDCWVKENRLDRLEFARQKLTYCYLSAAATLFSPELSDARISWAKNGILTTVVDDFFDIGGSVQELENLVFLIERWDGNHEKDFCSEQVKIIFSAIHSTVNELATKAFLVQDRNVTDHLVEIWLNLVKSMMIEADWQRNKSVPTLEKYMENGVVSFALGPIILPALYFVGPKLAENVIKDPEYDNLYRLVSTCGRLLNDMQGFEREGAQGKLNSISLRISNTSDSTSIEVVKKEIQKTIDRCRVELLQLVLKEGTVVRKPCKELFWMMSKILHLFYMKTDGFSSPREMANAVNAVIYEPLILNFMS